MKINTLRFTVSAIGILGMLIPITTIHGAEVPKEEKNTNTQIEIVDSSDIAILKLTRVPEQYKFTTKLRTEGDYEINGGLIEKSNNITVFNDKSAQDWSVKASIVETKLSTKSGKNGKVTDFKINGQSLMGQKANQIVHKSETNKTIDNNTGNISKEVKNDGISVEFNNEKHDLKAGDILTGKVHYQLFNTPDAK